MKFVSRPVPKLRSLSLIGWLAFYSACATEQDSRIQEEGPTVGAIDSTEPGLRQPMFVVARLVTESGLAINGNRIFYRWGHLPRNVSEDQQIDGNRAEYDQNGDAWLIAHERRGLSYGVNGFLTADIPFGERTGVIGDFSAPDAWERTVHLWALELQPMRENRFEMEVRVPNTEVDPTRNGCVIPSEACVRDTSACTVAELDADCQHTAVDLAWPSTTVSFTIDDMRAIEAVTAINPDPERGGYPTEMTLPVILLTLDADQKLSAELVAETMPVQHPEYRYRPVYCSGLMYELRVPWDELPWECREYAEQGLMETEEEYRERTFDPYGDRDFAPGED